MEAIRKDYTRASISYKDKCMLEYSKKLTNESYKIVENDILKLKEAGFSELQIFDINQVIAYFNYVNRIADGLGVKLEDR